MVLGDEEWEDPIRIQSIKITSAATGGGRRSVPSAGNREQPVPTIGPTRLGQFEPHQERRSQYVFDWRGPDDGNRDPVTDVNRLAALSAEYQHDISSLGRSL